MRPRLVFLLPMLLVASPLAAAPEPGQWSARTQAGTIWLFEVARTGAGWSARWLRPTHFQFSDGVFSAVQGPNISWTAGKAREVDGDLEVVFNDPAPGEEPSVFRLHAVDATHGTATLIGSGLEPFPLLRVENASIAVFDREGRYAMLVERPTNAEMTRIFEADQAARAEPAKVDWSVVGPQDEARRQQTLQLLDAGQLNSGDDFLHAAFVFQHGQRSGDFLKAHLLAMIAVARGRPDATWIASASLDRYLQSIGQPQVLGTQFHAQPDKSISQEPYDRGLISDAGRQALGVPTQAEQVEQGKRFEAEFKGD